LPNRLAAFLAWALLAALLAGCAPAGTQETHVREASFRIEPGASWDIPETPPFAAGEAQGWTQVQLPHARERSVAAPGETQDAPPEVAWYRIDVPSSAAAATPGELFLYLPRWQTIGNLAVYADGRLIHRTRGSLVWNSFNRPLWIALTSSAQEAPPRTLMVRMASQAGVGGALSTAWIDSAENILWRYRVREWIQSDLITVTSASFLVIGLFSLAVWFTRRKEAIYGLFFAASVANALRSAHYTIADKPPPLPDDWFGWITVNSLGWSMVWVFSFMSGVHRKRMPTLESLIIMIVVLISLATLPIPLLMPHVNTVLPAVYIVVTSLTAIVAVSGVWASWKSGSREGLVLSLWFTLTIPASIHDILLQNYRIDIEHIYSAPYIVIGVFAIFMAIVWRRYTGAIHEVETVNARLEARLASRERDLTASHNKLRELERQRTLSTERQRMMQDMHDGIGSSLMSALRMVQKGRLSDADIAQVLKECIDDLKLSIDSLEPAQADLLGLLGMLRFRLAPRLQGAGIKLTWSVRDIPPLEWLDPPSALHILRIVQEILTNIIKHGEATAIDISTSDDAQGVTVTVRDNGLAFVPAQDGTASTGAKGLANVRSRALALGAQCAWTTSEGGNEFRLSLTFAGPRPGLAQ
jgi:signal transduction histidine kinase